MLIHAPLFKGIIILYPKTCPEETVYQLGTKDGYEDAILKPSSGATKEKRNIAKSLLDGAVNLLKRKSENIMAVVKEALENPLMKKKSHEEIAEAARMSV
ncbi:hypothetical protein SAMN05216249_106134 [Acetitomaculum ruminis DSM 5522]|uniref:Uncharacterized protein n=1 Tax=Acetitomaculum ruminis DSM 5522 TaxID=1120918 RepID=A0A1I0XI84_9FIRM|nr:hypothetical protein SAMN05216249_106134 [Acetitomaculum ruminis DSM 5522]